MESSLTVGDADNGGAITLHTGDTLSVRLQENPSTGYSWHTVLAPAGLLLLCEDAYAAAEHAPGVVGGGGVHEFRFTPRALPNEGASLRGWLRLLLLRPFTPGIADARLWEIEVTVT